MSNFAQILYFTVASFAMGAIAFGSITAYRRNKRNDDLALKQMEERHNKIMEYMAERMRDGKEPWQ